MNNLIESYKGKIDTIYSSIPWNYISNNEFNKIPNNRQFLSGSFL